MPLFIIGTSSIEELNLFCCNCKYINSKTITSDNPWLAERSWQSLWGDNPVGNSRKHIFLIQCFLGDERQGETT